MTSRNHSVTLLIVAACAAFATQGHANAQTANAAVSGKLITESGQPLADVTVVCRRAIRYITDTHFHMRPAPGELTFAAIATTRADGTFAAALPAGSYALCIDTPPDGYVDHCAWNLSGVYFTVSANATTAVKPVTIISGVRIHFLITDPQRLLPSAGKIEPLANIGAVTAGGVYRPATISSRSAAIVEAVVTVPHTSKVSTSVFSRTLKFSDSSGNAPAALPVNLSQGVTDTNVSLTVTK